MSTSLDVWTRACHFVLDQSSRARLHDIRAALNSISLGLEVLRHEDGSARAPQASQVLNIMQRDLLAAVDELTGLQTLVTVASQDRSARLNTAIEWACQVAQPVAKRCGVDLRTPALGSAPTVGVDRSLGLAVAVALIEAARTSPQGSESPVVCTAETDGLLIDWCVASAGQPCATEREAEGIDDVRGELLDSIPAIRHRLTRDGDRRALRIDLLQSV